MERKAKTNKSLSKNSCQIIAGYIGDKENCTLSVLPCEIIYMIIFEVEKSSRGVCSYCGKLGYDVKDPDHWICKYELDD